MQKQHKTPEEAANEVLNYWDDMRKYKRRAMLASIFGYAMAVVFLGLWFVYHFPTFVEFLIEIGALK